MQNKTKFIVGTITVSAAFFTSLVAHEGFSAKPYLDKGGVATIGYGSTKYENNKAVKITDKPISQQRAVQIAHAHVKKDEFAFNKSISNVRLSQAEYNSYLDFTYNFGQSNWNQSSMRRLLIQGKHRQACDALLKWKYVAGKDCSNRSNNCYGVWKRQLERHQKCSEVNT